MARGHVAVVTKLLRLVDTILSSRIEVWRILRDRISPGNHKTAIITICDINEIVTLA